MLHVEFYAEEKTSNFLGLFPIISTNPWLSLFLWGPLCETAKFNPLSTASGSKVQPEPAQLEDAEKFATFDPGRSFGSAVFLDRTNTMMERSIKIGGSLAARFLLILCWKGCFDFVFDGLHRSILFEVFLVVFGLLIDSLVFLSVILFVSVQQSCACSSFSSHFWTVKEHFDHILTGVCLGDAKEERPFRKSCWIKSYSRRFWTMCFFCFLKALMDDFLLVVAAFIQLLREKERELVKVW